MCLLFVCFAFFIQIINMNRLSVTAHPLQNSSSWELSNVLVFPKSEESVLPAPNCHNETFCENLEAYPVHIFHEILRSKPFSTRYHQYFQTLKDNEPLLEIRSESVKTEHFICPSTKSVVYPKAAYNVKEQIKFIYNLPGYRQAVSIETCVKQSKCKFYDRAKNFRTMCKQKFVEKLLLTADNNGRPYVDQYRFPSTCVCSYKPESSFAHFSQLYK